MYNKLELIVKKELIIISLKIKYEDNKKTLGLLFFIVKKQDIDN